MKTQSLRKERCLGFEIGAIIAAVVLCIGTYFIAGAFDTPPASFAVMQN